ncbi:GntR family transcriptional regulator [Marinobacter sp.]|uniref:GntR family transcriptional regulator n=1 Tax=Marinobacter sp. TaxID=50741 RepID=UPI00199B7418|nr:GntR family transcriptional regulator [Marinobacter sp.]MBC7193246.1 GntR family transcriptional regulator [Marinobacter sp.]
MGAIPRTNKQKEVDRIIESLSRAIAQHLLPPGTRLVEAQIVDSLQANRNHVQVALQRLALQRIVTIEPNRGARVSQPSAREAREIFVARRAIEGAVVASITPEKMRRFAREVDAHMTAEARATQSSDRRAIVRELSSFHQLLGRISGNSVLADIMENLMVRSSLIVALYQRNDEPSCQHDEHQAILEALMAGAVQEAEGLMKHHLDHLEAELALDDTESRDIDLKAVLASV